MKEIELKKMKIKKKQTKTKQANKKQKRSVFTDEKLFFRYLFVHLYIYLMYTCTFVLDSAL